MEAKSAREPGPRNLKKVMQAVIILMYNVTFPPQWSHFVFSPQRCTQSLFIVFCVLGWYGFSLSGRGIVRGMPLWGMDLNECIWLTSNVPIK